MSTETNKQMCRVVAEQRDELHVIDNKEGYDFYYEEVFPDYTKGDDLVGLIEHIEPTIEPPGHYKSGWRVSRDGFHFDHKNLGQAVLELAFRLSEEGRLQ